MQITLDNIGIIKNSTLTLEGLTVITGKNNSGKTTVGKTLYSLIDATSNLQRNARRDRDTYIRKQLRELENVLNAFSYAPEPGVEADYLSRFHALDDLLSGAYNAKCPVPYPEDYAYELEKDLTAVDSERMAELYGTTEFVIRRDKETQKWVKHEVPISEKFDRQRAVALDILSSLFEELKQDPHLTDYARERINQTLSLEFSGQIQPVKAPGVTSLVDLSDEESPYYHFTLQNNRIVKDGPVFFNAPFQRAYLIDDPYILDDPKPARLYRMNAQEFEGLVNTSNISTHSQKLLTKLRFRSGPNPFEQMLLDKSLEQIREQIEQVISGSFEFSPDGNYYVENGVKLRVSNLAAGSKLFSILKILLEKGELDASTLLILDEPESHLHPQWQNTFAEVIVLLVKNLNMRVLLTTHSSNFMLALDAFMRKHGINQRTNFYQTRSTGDGFVEYECVNDDMGRIYQDFLQYLSEVKQLRNLYMHGGGDGQ